MTQITAKTIRAGAVAALTAGVAGVAGRVYGMRTTKLPDSQIPALLVYSGDGRGEPRSIGAPVFRWTLQLVVEIVASDTTDNALGDTLDDLAEAVESTLIDDTDWVSQFEAIESIDRQLGFDDSGNTRRAAVKMTFGLRFNRDYEALAADATDLSTVEVQADMIAADGAPDDAIDAALSLTLEA